MFKFFFVMTLLNSYGHVETNVSKKSMKSCMVSMAEEVIKLETQGWQPYADQTFTLVSEDGDDEITFKCKMKS